MTELSVLNSSLHSFFLCFWVCLWAWWCRPELSETAGALIADLDRGLALCCWVAFTLDVTHNCQLHSYCALLWTTDFWTLFLSGFLNSYTNSIARAIILTQCISSLQCSIFLILCYCLENMTYTDDICTRYFFDKGMPFNYRLDTFNNNWHIWSKCHESFFGYFVS